VRLAKGGRETAILERRRFGGTCVEDGRIPTKTLIATACAAADRDRLGVFDIRRPARIIGLCADLSHSLRAHNKCR
jgi:pyruvate/2-oxoglutarate dehydrogenase complex dihydrolipoamide dehydrogenase (E3) component